MLSKDEIYKKLLDTNGKCDTLDCVDCPFKTKTSCILSTIDQPNSIYRYKRAKAWWKRMKNENLNIWKNL